MSFDNQKQKPKGADIMALTQPEFHSDANVTIIRFPEPVHLDAHFFALQEELEHLLEEGKHRLVLDMGNVTYISAAGTGILLGILQKCRENGGDLKLANISEKIKKFLDMLGFSRYIKICESEEEAIRSFSKTSGKETQP